MAYGINLNLPEGWDSKTVTYKEAGEEITHLQAFLPDDRIQSDLGAIDIYVGPVPEGSSAEQEAYNSYCEMFGREAADEDDEALVVWPFQGHEAFGYEALCEDDSPMRFMAVEPLPGVLAIITVAFRNDLGLQKMIQTVEKDLRISQQP